MPDSISFDLLPFHPQELNVERVCALSELVSACKKEDVKITKAYFYQNGFQVQFEDIPGDAILHDGSYGKIWCHFETIGMPWDNDDVSVHDPETLAKLLGALKRGEDWEKYNK